MARQNRSHCGKSRDDALKPSVLLFYVATLTPVPLISLAALYGGAFVWLALLYLTVFTFVMDHLIAAVPQPVDQPSEFPASDGLTLTLALAHFLILGLTVWALTANTALATGEKIGLFFAAGLFLGQISNANAHELIHRPGWLMFTIGKCVFISLQFGHHCSAHRLVHHVYVGTDADPNTPRLNESLYHFIGRAWIGSFKAGYAAERRLRSTNGARATPYFQYVFGSALLLAVCFILGGTTALILYLALTAYTSFQLLSSDYVQHYGLRRGRDSSGRPVPVSESHSWNAPQVFSAHMMLNAPRHSDHHLHPSTEFPDLQLTPEMPLLPHSLPVMGALALFPKTWRRVMNPRVAKVNAASPISG